MEQLAAALNRLIAVQRDGVSVRRAAERISRTLAYHQRRNATATRSRQRHENDAAL